MHAVEGIRNVCLPFPRVDPFAITLFGLKLHVVKLLVMSIYLFHMLLCQP